MTQTPIQACNYYFALGIIASRSDGPSTTRLDICNGNTYMIKPVSNVESGEEVVEAVGPHVPRVEDDDAHHVPNKSKNSSN